MSLYSDLKEVLTPYAQRIKRLADANDEIKANLGDIGDIDAIKSALMACFKKVAWSDGSGQDCYDDLYDALYTTTNEVRIDGTRLTWEDGYIDASGELTVSSGAKTSNFIDVSGYSSYEISLENASSLRMSFYNSSREFLSRSLVGSDSIPSNASYGRVTIGRSDLLEGVDYDGTGTTIVLTKTGV